MNHFNKLNSWYVIVDLQTQIPQGENLILKFNTCNTIGLKKNTKNKKTLIKDPQNNLLKIYFLLFRYWRENNKPYFSRILLTELS